MNDYSGAEEPLFDTPPLEPAKPPFNHTFALLDFWDYLSNGESETTRQIREALRKDFTELGISA